MEKKTTAMSRKLPVPYLALLVGCLLHSSCLGAVVESDGLDWPRIAKLRPKLKVLVLVEGDRSLNLRDLALLAEQGLVPADRDPGAAIGLKRLIFSGTLRHWTLSPRLPRGFKGRLLSKFFLSGIYRVGFAVAFRGYRGPLKLRITAPRESFGRKLIYADQAVRPVCETFVRVDEAGNRWFEAAYPEVKDGDRIRFHFAFIYEVDVAEMLAHDLVLAEGPLDTETPSDIQRFLRRGHKIDPGLPDAVKWAEEGPPGPPDARTEYGRLTETLAGSVRYDQPKRNAYFGGRAVYSDIDRMYRQVGETLRTGKGCCPDTVLLECSFLRARGIPCRTAGRFGHFFSHVYLPGRGWMSTSVTPTAIPLIESPGTDHVPYQNWTPQIPLRTTHWEAGLRIYDLEELEWP